VLTSLSDLYSKLEEILVGSSKLSSCPAYTILLTISTTALKNSTQSCSKKNILL